MIMKKRLSDLRLQDEIKLFTALIMILVIIFQLIIYAYYYISLKSQRDYIYESINVMMNETIANQLSKLDKYQNLMTQQKSLRLFLNNTANSEQQFELENTIYTLQQISDSTLYGVVFDENGHLHKLSQNISDSKISEIEKMYKEYINSPNKNRYYFFVIPDSSYREIYFLCFGDVNENVLTEKVKEINGKGKGRAIGIVCDVRDYNQVCNARDKAVKEFGGIDVVTNFAGGSSTRINKVDRNCYPEFPDVPIDIFDWGMDVNLKGPFYFAHAVLKQMREQKRGLILNIGSIVGAEGCELDLDYATSKAGLMFGLTKSIAQYGAKYGVRCVCVSPGPVLTRPEMANLTTEN